MKAVKNETQLNTFAENNLPEGEGFFDEEDDLPEEEGFFDEDDDLPEEEELHAREEVHLDEGVSSAGADDLPEDDLDEDPDNEDDEDDEEEETEEKRFSLRRIARILRRPKVVIEYEKPKIGPAYLAFWCIYWAALLIFAFVYRETIVTPIEEETVSGDVIFRLLLAAIAGSAVICLLMQKLIGRRDIHHRRVFRYVRFWNLLLMIAVAVYCFLIIEYINNPIFKEMEPRYMAMNVLGILIISLILFFWLNSLQLTLITVLIVWAVVSIVFYVVYQFRGEPFQLIDIFSVETALNVAGSYTFVMPRSIAVDIVCSFCILAVLIHLPDYKLGKKTLTKILMRVCIFLAMIGGYYFYLNVNWNGGSGILTDLFAPIKTYKEYGTTVGFFCVAKYMRLTAPEDYSVGDTEEIALAAIEEEEPNTATDVKPANIIVVMNESWADYRYVGDLNTTQPVMPFYDSLTENAIKGHTLVCITGGGTAKTEYEFLTGNSVKRFPGMVPYVSYFTHDQYSLVTTLEAQGYASAAMHPYKGSNWKRPIAYELLNFDHFYTQDDFDSSYEKIHSHISDKANYQKILELVKQKEDPDDPLFLFNITMQNHGGYTRDDIEIDVEAIGYDDDEVNRYLSLMKRTDEALEYLVTSLSEIEEPTLLVVFGDHYPTMPEGFTEYISGSKFEDLGIEEQEHYYATPFLIWANYDIEEQTGIMTSTNYLGTLMLEQTGLEMAHYNYYLKDLMKEIPALNHLGYMDSDGEFHTWKEGEEKELHLEWEYECLQYNNLAESGRRLDWFFGMEE